MNIEEWEQNEGIVDFSTAVINGNIPIYGPTGCTTTPVVIGEPNKGLPTVWTQEWPVERPKRRPRPTIILEPREEAPVEKKIEFDPILIFSLVRRALPNLIAYDICGVLPMSGPTGLIFAMRSRYDSGKQRRKERYKYDEDDSKDSLF